MLLDSLDVSRGSEAATGSGLIFPLKGQSRRVSEQEVRFLFAHAVEAAAAHGKLHYAVEVPTEKTYHFSGQGERRASTDLALYLAPDLERPLLNVEFKAHGRSTNRSVHTAVRKDIASPRWGTRRSPRRRPLGLHRGARARQAPLLPHLRARTAPRPALLHRRPPRWPRRDAHRARLLSEAGCSGSR
jgi:hypothetical protein